MVATVPTEVTTPGVVRLSGRVMTTWSPTLTSDCWAASRAMVTTRVVEVACRTGWPAWSAPPSVADTVVTRTATGSNTACPRGRVPVWDMPRVAWSFFSAVAVAAGEGVRTGRYLRRRRIAEGHQIRVQLGHVRARSSLPIRSGTPGSTPQSSTTGLSSTR